LFYLDPVRRYLIHAASRLLVTSKLITNDRPGWQKIYAQYRWISLAVLSSIDRAIEKRILAPHVAGRIFELWGRALLPSRQRRLIIQRFSKEHGAPPPWFLVISPTRACNLACTGCYANAGSGTGIPQPANLPWDMLDRIVTEAKEQWGICLFVFSGGEPLAYRSQGKDLLDLVSRHDDCLFLMFTNGTLITSETARRLARQGNLTPALSVEGLGEATNQRRGEGTFERVLEAMSELRAAGVPFGISMTATRANCEQILSDRLLDFYFGEQGAFYAFIFQYMPIGKFPNLDWMPSPDQRVPFWKRSWQVVRQRRLFLLDFWNHGPLVEGCIAAARDRGYLHIDWNGDVMPCVFMPYVAANLHEIYQQGGSLTEVWQSPLFRDVREWQRNYGYGGEKLSKEGNWMAPCPFRDHFSDVQAWLKSLQPKPQEGVAPLSAMDESFCQRMVAYGSEQARQVEEIWEKEYLE
jgi:MoaA/NifB/PqqE/SkfB family radical SAM enzyme